MLKKKGKEIKANRPPTTVINKLNIVQPVITQSLTSDQLTQIAESYNRKLYDDIKNK